jgi:4-hydroxybenzoate polyprenyltransferase/phosphoserine phosphatase
MSLIPMEPERPEPAEDLARTSVESTALCVDLDGTLIVGDLLWESLFAVARTQPHVLLKLPVWLFRGRAAVKSGLAAATIATLEMDTLGFRPEVVDFLKQQKRSGRRLVLATAADGRLARRVADHLGLFEEVIASDGTLNLKGAVKAKALTERFGRSGFDYIGDSKVDHAIWREARGVYVVGSRRRVVEHSCRVYEVRQVFEVPQGGARAILKAMRPHQWAKNMLIFVPLITSHQLGDPVKALRAVAAFLAYSLVASAVYILNDLLDLPNDRRHKTKCKRPFAAGKVSIPAGVVIFGALIALGATLSALLPTDFSLLLAIYLVLTTAYSTFLKRRLLVDVLALSSLYTLRILAGGAAEGVVVSSWLLAFAVFFFLSLAFAKRYTELDSSRGELGKLAGRGYQVSDLEMIRSIGPTSGYLSVVVLCLYLNSPEMRILYSHPGRLWLLCPVLLYWISRLWFLASRKELDEDPILFAVRDRHSYVAGAIMFAVLILAV